MIVQNLTNFDINYIKFRVILNDNNNNSVFFNQTVEANIHIPKGDIVRIDIPGLKDFYAGSNLIEDGFNIDGGLIEVNSKPLEAMQSCLQVEELELLLQEAENID